jgi:L-xylulokinase
MTLVLGLDCGLTYTKAVVFDDTGELVGRAGCPSPHATPHPHWVERDPDALWRAAADSVRAAIAETGRPAADIAAVGVTAHGDGLYCARGDGTATRPGMSSLDSRARDIAQRWQADGTARASLALTGQEPTAASPVTLLAWLAEHEPDTLARTRWILPCKDWIRLRLTGEAGTDRTEASTSFTNMRTQDYDDAVLALFGLGDYADRLPPIRASWEISGRVTADAAALTGLAEGTPVVAGLHDVDASAIGSGAVRPGQLSVIAGTYSINEVVATEPRPDPRWFTRNFLEPGTWQHMSISPASATNLEWFIRELCRDLADAPTEDVYRALSDAYAAVSDEPSDVLFLPYLYGAPAGVDTDAAFVGVGGWHRREHLLRAVLEGVVFNHRRHIDALAEQFTIDEVRLTGGASRAAHWAQLFADALGRPVRVVRTEETGALGVALCALVGIGRYPDVPAAAAAVRTDSDSSVLFPRPERHTSLEGAYQRFLRVTDALGAAVLSASTA